MSNTNPTDLQIGATGMLDGHRYTVRGRVVLSVEQDEETYYWNEYHLADGAGAAVTLVFEIEENGPAWKLFRLFEPAQPMTAAQAATKRVGEIVQFGGQQAKVTLVNRSRVEFVAGQAPEGVEVGDVADYFNAEVGERMIVVSWSGDEVEFYDGAPVAARRVEAAFHLPKDSGHPKPSLLSTLLGSGDSSGHTFVWVVLVALVWFGVSVYEGSADDSPPPPPPRQAAPVLRLPTGTHGRLAGHTYAITGHALVEVARIGKVFERHEYALADEKGGEALLIHCLGGRLEEWCLLTAREHAIGFTPYDAATFRQGWIVDLAGRKAKVDQLMQIRVLAQDGTAPAIFWPTGLEDGFTAEATGEILHVRWTESRLQIYGGQPVSQENVLAGWGLH